MNTEKLLGGSDLSKATGVGRETLRFYEEKGLVTPIGRTVAGYRQYDRSAVELITFIKETQQAGFSLKEIQELLELRNTSTNTCNNVGEILKRKSNMITAEIENLQRKKAIIESMASSCCKPGGSSRCSLVP